MLDDLTYRGDWISTYGGKFFPLDPKEEDINIETIAHALSMLCRFGGHINEFYSVAQHCCLCSEMAPVGYKLEALMHDASEAYLVDIPRPIKGMLPDYKLLEKSIETVIANKFNLPMPMSPAIKLIDNRMLITEADQLLNESGGAWWNDPNNPNYCEKYDIRIKSWDPTEAKQKFLDYYHYYARNNC